MHCMVVVYLRTFRVARQPIVRLLCGETSFQVIAPRRSLGANPMAWLLSTYGLHRYFYLSMAQAYFCASSIVIPTVVPLPTHQLRW